MQVHYDRVDHATSQTFFRAAQRRLEQMRSQGRNGKDTSAAQVSGGQIDVQVEQDSRPEPRVSEEDKSISRQERGTNATQSPSPDEDYTK